MKTNIRILIIGLVCILIGTAVGFFTAGRITKQRIHKKVEMQEPPKFKLHLEEKLDLSTEQQEHFNTVFKEHMVRMRQMDQELFENRAAEFEKLFADLKTGLNKEQQDQLDNFEQRFKNRKHKRMPPHHNRE
jgi:hypothetical protein